IRTVVELKDYTVVDKPIDGGIPSAQATIDSLGTSSGYAAEPYPGEVVLTAPGTGAIALSQICGPLHPSPCPAVPDYPLIAQSTYPGQDRAAVDQGPTKLRAQSSDSESSSSADSGLGDPKSGGGGRTATNADATHVTATGAVRATAESTVEAVTFGDVLRIGRSPALAKVTQDVGR